MTRGRPSGGKSTGADAGFGATGPSLFEAAARKSPELTQSQPLAERLRPQSIDEMVGQRHLLGLGKPLVEAITVGRVPSMILWGPPGSGKTTLARLLAQTSKARFVPFSAVLGGVAEVRQIVAEAKERRALG